MPLNFVTTPTTTPKRVATPSSTTLPTASIANAPSQVQPTPTIHTTPTPLPVSVPSLVSNSLFPNPSAPAAPKSRILLWFRSDLRLHDHPALNHALEEGKTIVPVYIFDPRHFGKTAFGFEKTGRYRAKFLVDSVKALRTSLRSIGSDLVIRHGKPEDVLPDLCAQLNLSVVMCHREVSYEDHKLEHVLRDRLSQRNIELTPLWANTLYHVDDLPFSVEDLPDVYTKFRESVQRQSQIRPPLRPPSELPSLPRVNVGKVPTLAQLGLTEPLTDGVYSYTGGEQEALKRLKEYVHGKGRDTVQMSADFSCHISPWLALGCVSPRRIYADLEECAGKAGQTATYFELVWRDFFRYITAKYNRAKVAERMNKPAVGAAL